MLNSSIIRAFVAWICTHLCYTLFILWAYLPDPVLNDLGVTYFPSKYWAVAMPCHVLVSFAIMYLLYWFYNLMRLPQLRAFQNVMDEYSKAPDEKCAVDILPYAPWSPAACCCAVWGQGEHIPRIYDLQITSVNAALYSWTPYRLSECNPLSDGL